MNDRHRQLSILFAVLGLIHSGLTVASETYRLGIAGIPAILIGGLIGLFAGGPGHVLSPAAYHGYRLLWPMAAFEALLLFFLAWREFRQSL